jgi:hypothetical protein
MSFTNIGTIFTDKTTRHYNPQDKHLHLHRRENLKFPPSVLAAGMVIGGPFPGGKARPGRDADHSPPSSAEVKNE